MDILWKREDGVFSYRAAGLLQYNGKILLQHASNEPGFVVPGGHVAFGETSAETLRREFREECGADIVVGALCGVGEIYFPWGTKPCHQICLYYHVSLADPTTFPTDGVISGIEHLENRRFSIDFHWIPLNQLSGKLLYPPQIVDMARSDRPVSFIYREEN